MSYFAELTDWGARPLRFGKKCDLCGAHLSSIEEEYAEIEIHRGPYAKQKTKHLCLECYDKIAERVENGRETTIPPKTD